MRPIENGIRNGPKRAQVLREVLPNSHQGAADHPPRLLVVARVHEGQLQPVFLQRVVALGQQAVAVRIDLVQHGVVSGQQQLVGVRFMHSFEGVFVHDHHVGGAVWRAPGYLGTGARGEGRAGGGEGAVAEMAVGEG